MTSKCFSTAVLVIATPFLIPTVVAIFYNPVHIFTAMVLAAGIACALFEKDEDGENLYQAIRRVVKRE